MLEETLVNLSVTVKLCAGKAREQNSSKFLSLNCMRIWEIVVAERLQILYKVGRNLENYVTAQL